MLPTVKGGIGGNRKTRFLHTIAGKEGLKTRQSAFPAPLPAKEEKMKRTVRKWLYDYSRGPEIMASQGRSMAYKRAYIKRRRWWMRHELWLRMWHSKQIHSQPVDPEHQRLIQELMGELPPSTQGE